jgi:hypothetical protein
MMQPRIDAIDVYGGKKPTGPQPALLAAVSKVTEAIYPDDKWGLWSAHFRSQPHIGHLGGFHWLVTGSRVPIKDQFDAFVKGWDSIGGMRPGEFWIVDVERTTWNGQVLPDPTIAEVVQFCQMCEAHFGPNRGLLYGNSGWSQFWAWHAANPTFPVWYANSNIDETSPQSGWRLSAQLGAIAWQWGSPVGAVSGVESWAGGPTATDVNHIFHPEWFAALNPTEDDMPTIYRFTDAGKPCLAAFIGSANGTRIEARWITTAAELEAFKALGLREVGAPVSAAKALWLDGPVPTGDPNHTWKLTDFAGQVTAPGTSAPFPTKMSGSIDLSAETFTGTLA